MSSEKPSSAAAAGAADTALGSAVPIAGAKAYFELAIDNNRLHIDYLGGSVAAGPPQEGHAVAWLEEKDARKHHFWFKLRNKSYIVSAKYAANSGFDAVLTLIANDADLTFAIAQNVNRLTSAKWGIVRTRQNDSPDVKVFRTTIIKGEGDPNSRFDIRLRLRYYTNNEVGGSITNPICIIEDEP